MRASLLAAAVITTLTGTRCSIPSSHGPDGDRDTAILPERVQGYDPVPGGFAHAISASMTIPNAAGFLYSTTGDLLKWQEGLFGGKVLSAASLKTMTTPYRGDYVMGLFVLDTKHHGVITHNGAIDGFDAR